MRVGTRGLPGFLRRSRLSDDSFEDDSTTDDEEDNNNENDDDSTENKCIDEENNSIQSNNPIPLTSVPEKSSSNAFKKDNEIGISFGSHLSDRVRHDSGNDFERNENPSTNDHDSDDDSSVSTIGEHDLVIHNKESSRSSSGSNRNRSFGSGRHSSFASIPKTYRENQFEKILCIDEANKGGSVRGIGKNLGSGGNKVVNMAELRKISWNGIPPQYRGMSWKILLGYLPTNSMRRQTTLKRKRSEYKESIAQHYYIDDNSRTIQEQETLRQVLVDVPRTAPDVPLFRNEKIKRALSRLLYTWAIRHPASSYVQGINDLATPLFAVFLSDDYEGEDVLDGSVMVVLEEERLEEVEADVYWCLTNILAGIQDHYTADQPGVQRMVMRLEELVNRIDADLSAHIQSVGIQFIQFAFKWMNCLLLREFNLRCVIRLWDTYISEGGMKGFEDFHVYVCAAFLSQFSSQLQEMEFDEMFQFMQQVPTEDWGEVEIEMLLSHAYVLSTLFGGSDAHLTSTTPATNDSMM